MRTRNKIFKKKIKTKSQNLINLIYLCELRALRGSIIRLKINSKYFFVIYFDSAHVNSIKIIQTKVVGIQRWEFLTVFSQEIIEFSQGMIENSQSMKDFVGYLWRRMKTLNKKAFLYNTRRLIIVILTIKCVP